MLSCWWAVLGGWMCALPGVAVCSKLASVILDSATLDANELSINAPETVLCVM